MEIDVIPPIAEISLKNNILNRVALSNAFFRSQQLGEKDLTFEEKRNIAESLLERNKPLFLQRYWKFINAADAKYFELYKDNYEVEFYLKEIYKLQDSRKRQVQIRNRRYEALKIFIRDGSYFSEEEMKERNPFLYEQLVGQYMTEDERAAADVDRNIGNQSFSGFLMQRLEKDQINILMKQQQEEEASAFEEGESDEEDEEYDDGIEKGVQLADSEKQMLRNEFINIMYESFLSGRDKNFDYSSIDDNAEYDSVEQRERDEEEQYFDDESPDYVEKIYNEDSQDDMD